MICIILLFNEWLYMKICSKCNKNKDKSQFNKNKLSKDGLYAWCRECSNKHSAVHRDSATDPNRLTRWFDPEEYINSGYGYIKYAVWFKKEADRIKGRIVFRDGLMAIYRR